MKQKIVMIVLLFLRSFSSPAQQHAAAPCKAPISKGGFEMLRDNITATDFDDTRLEAAEPLIQKNCFTSEQVVRLCKLFLQDASRLKIAKWAYPHAVDPGNYAKVNVVFEQDENKKALNDFINGSTNAH